MSTCVLKALPGKLDIKRHSPSILYNKDDVAFRFGGVKRGTNVIWINEPIFSFIFSFLSTDCRRVQDILVWTAVRECDHSRL